MIIVHAIHLPVIYFKPYGLQLIISVFGRCAVFQVHPTEDCILAEFLLDSQHGLSAFSVLVPTPVVPALAVPSAQHSQ